MSSVFGAVSKSGASLRRKLRQGWQVHGMVETWEALVPLQWQRAIHFGFEPWDNWHDETQGVRAQLLCFCFFSHVLQTTAEWPHVPTQAVCHVKPNCLHTGLVCRRSRNTCDPSQTLRCQHCCRTTTLGLRGESPKWGNVSPSNSSWAIARVGQLDAITLGNRHIKAD